MVSYQLLSLLESVLGTGQNTVRDNYKFYSPFINHRKKKLEINLATQIGGKNKWHCWVSDEAGLSIYSLFKRMAKETNLINDSHFEKLSTIFKSLPIELQAGSKKYKEDAQQKVERVDVELPKTTNSFREWLSQSDRNDPLVNIMFDYLTSRGVTIEQMIMHNISYNISPNTKYYNSIIFPSYDIKGKLNYFITHKHKEGYYMKPKLSQYDVTFNEAQIDFKQPITIVEGVYDALSIDYNSVPLLGKNLSHSLLYNIVEHNTKCVNLLLDQEYEARKKSLKIAHKLKRCGVEEVNVYFWDEELGDVNEMGLDSIEKNSIVLDSNSYNSSISYSHILNTI